MTNTDYFACLQAPQATKEPASRKVWSIDLQKWVKVFKATNAGGRSTIPIPSEALGYPLRLAYDKTGAVRFSQAGRPLRRVAKEISDNIRLMREYYERNLMSQAEELIKAYPTEYQAQEALAVKAGEPLRNFDKLQESNALKARADAEAATIAKAATDAEAVAQAEEAVKVKGRKVRELVPA